MDGMDDGALVGTPKKSARRPRLEALVRLGERIRDERRRRGYTQAELAESLNLSVAYVSLIERGGRNPPYTTVVDIARALGVPAAQMVPDA
jgi:transcriptional regulator with XRE-family HTH domain